MSRPTAPTGPTAHPIGHPPGEQVEVGGRRLWVERHGAGEPLLLLAGFGPAGSHVVFHPTFDALIDSYEVIYVDLYGRGRSDRPASPGEISFASDVADVVRLVEVIGGPVHVYGFSYGGLLAQALAVGHPRLVRSLVLANTLHSPEMWQRNHENINRELANQHPEAWERILGLRRLGHRSTSPEVQAAFAEAARLVRFFHPDVAESLPNEPGARNAELYPAFCGVDVDFVIGPGVAAIPDFRPRLAEVRCPTLVLAGRYDRALYPAMQREFQQFAPAFELRILERSGSFCHLEEAEAVVSLLRRFLPEAALAATTAEGADR